MKLNEFQNLLQGICDEKVGKGAVEAVSAVVADDVDLIRLETRKGPSRLLYVIEVLEFDVALATKKEALAWPCVKAIGPILDKHKRTATQEPVVPTPRSL